MKTLLRLMIGVGASCAAMCVVAVALLHNFWYAALLDSTHDGTDSARAELEHARSFLSATRWAAR